MGKHNINYLHNFGSLIIILVIFGEWFKTVSCDVDSDPFYKAANTEDPAASQVTQNIIADTDYKDTNEDENNSFYNIGLNFWPAFVASLSVILVSELGDKTFFIAAIMAMRHSRLIIFFGAMLALALMTILSVIFGKAAQIIPRVYTYYISTALFMLFGLKMLWDAYHMSPADTQEEIEEVQSDIRRRDGEYEREVSAREDNPESADDIGKVFKISACYTYSRIFLQAFTMTFLAEWGDRSQITTIILAARENLYGITAGGILGHCICTGIAVIGGRLIAQRISVRTVTFIGGVVFIIFALSAFFFDPNDDEFT